MLICGALPPEEMPRLALAKDLSLAEQRQLISWQDPPAWSSAASNDAPPGRGNFMIKIGGRPGIPFRVTLTKAEQRLHDTNKLWHEQSRRGELRPRRHVATPDARRAEHDAPGRQARDRPLDALAAADGHARARRLGRRGRGSRRAGRRGDRPLASPPAGGSARPGARARRRPDPLAARRHADPDRRRGRLRADRGRRRRARSRDAAAGDAARIGRRGCSVPAAACIRLARNAQATAERFGVEQPGLPIARAIAGGQTLYATWEDMQCDIWGPRKGKSSSRAIPTLLAAPGAAFATSNKPDLYAATRALREQHGRVWNFDPEAIAAGEADWWWNPLSYVTSDRRALELTDAFVGAYRDPDARPDPFFDPAGQELVSHLLRAAALAERPMTQAFLWSTRPNDDEPARILTDHGLELAAASVLDHVHAPFEQRGGVYGTARQILSFLRDPDIARWVTSSGTADRRRAARPRRVRGVGRHAVPAQQGRAGQLRGLVTALAMALCDAAEQLAKRSPGGRLPVPLVGVLDEAANICRWRQLPDLYCHYGSRGIPLLTLLQSWSQGAQVWGQTGMRKLWGASNVRVYGGGAARARVPLRSGEADRRVQPAGREPEQPTGARRRQHEHQLAADPDADPDRR